MSQRPDVRTGKKSESEHQSFVRGLRCFSVEIYRQQSRDDIVT